jgi:DNA-binding XRE family transcriptional regulator
MSNLTIIQKIQEEKSKTKELDDPEVLFAPDNSKEELSTNPGTTLWQKTNINLDELAESIHKERKSQKISQRTLASITGLSQTTIMRAEKNYTSNIYTITKVIQALGKKLIIN